jgi:hypothetical protein
VDLLAQQEFPVRQQLKARQVQLELLALAEPLEPLEQLELQVPLVLQELPD